MASLYNKLKSTLKSSRKVKGDETPKEVDLFSPIKVGEIGTAKNRVALAPMTRARATNDGVVGKHQAEYYAQRASGGLLITEGVNISPEAIGWWCTPNIFTEEQVLAWKPVTKAVHDADGLIVAQLWHTGRSSHSDYQPGNKLPVAPSAIPLKGDGAHVPGSWEVKPYETPRALETEEIPDLINAYVTAAKHAIEDAGFDGIELHSANGYILDEFLQSKTNQRTDKYGGSVDNRVRLTDELLTALCKVLPPGKIAIRYSPNAVYNDTGSPDNLETFDKAVEVAAKHKIAFIHIVDGLAFGFHNLSEPYTLERASKIIKAVQGKNVVTRLMGNCGYTKETAEKAIKDGHADMISFGRAYMVNPDLVYRFKNNIPLATRDGYDYFYTPAAPDPSVGYTDFPAAKK